MLTLPYSKTRLLGFSEETFLIFVFTPLQYLYCNLIEAHLRIRRGMVPVQVHSMFFFLKKNEHI
jgi:hypothetical protein